METTCWVVPRGIQYYPVDFVVLVLRVRIPLLLFLRDDLRGRFWSTVTWNARVVGAATVDRAESRCWTVP